MFENVIRNLKSRRLIWAGDVVRMMLSNAYGISVGKHEGKRPLGSPRRRWKDIIQLYLRQMCCDTGNSLDLAQDSAQWRAYLRTVLNLRVL